MLFRKLNFAILIFAINLLLANSLFAQDQDQHQNQEQVLKTIQIMTQKLVEQQLPDGRFEGAFEADPGFELLSLVLIKKYGTRDFEIEKQFINKALKWNTASGFGSYPKGPYNHDITGLVLISLRDLGYSLTDLKLDSVQKSFNAHGGIDKLNLGTKILLAPLNLASLGALELIVRPAIINIPSMLPFSQKNLGIFRSMLVPLATWNYYRSKNTKRFYGSISLSEKNERTAENGIQWILHHQMSNGTWYTMFHTIINISALIEAQKAGVGNYNSQIQKALAALINWRTKNLDGDITQQLTLTTGWDTPQTLMALSELPQEIQNQYMPQIKKAVNFLDQNQITELGDWAINSPKLLAGGWSFIAENRDYPDTDVANSVLEAKYAFPQFSSREKFFRGLNWILGLQNTDGGFPAWEKGVSKFTDKIIKTILPTLPDYSDLSQTDVSARIGRFLNKLINDPKTAFMEREVLQTSLDQSCKYILKNSDDKKQIVWKGRWLVAYLYGTSEVVDALVSTGCRDITEVQASMRWLVSKQNADGGFGEDHTSFIAQKFVASSSTVIQTAYVVQSLISYELKYKEVNGSFSPFKKNLDRAMNFLILKAQADNGLIKERKFLGVIGARLWYANYALGPQFMTLRALGRYYQLSH